MKKHIAAALGLILLAATGAQAQNRTAINVNLFAGASAVPIYIAQDKDFFAREGLTVNAMATPNSGFQMSGLVSGQFDIASTALDNLIAYMEGQGTAKLSREPDLVTIMGGSSTELSLIAQPSIKSIADLKGKEFALDSLATGFAFVLRHMLEKNGIGVSDIKMFPAGSSRERTIALREGKAAAALISEPFTSQMRAAGFTDLGDAVQSVGPYQASVQIANQPWAKANPQAVSAYIRALIAAVDWIYNPANHEEAARILAGRVRISLDAAKPSIAGLVKGHAALARKAELDLEGVKNVIALREKYGSPQKKMGPIGKYVDLVYYEAAIKR